MKVEPGSDAASVSSKRQEAGEKSGGFSKAMRKAREREEEERNLRPASAPAGRAAPSPPEAAAGEVQAAGAAPDLKLMEGLAREISVVTHGAADHEVTIQFDSRTLDGLRVQIRKAEGAITIRLEAATEETQRILSANVDALALALRSKGVPLEAVHMRGPAGREEKRRYSQEERRDGRQQRGGRER